MLEFSVTELSINWPFDNHKPSLNYVSTHLNNTKKSTRNVYISLESETYQRFTVIRKRDGSENIKRIKILDRRNSYVPKKVLHFINYKINCSNSTVPYTLAQHLLNLTI